MPKKVKKNPQKTLVSFILDETGSMSSIRAATISGFNEFVRSLKGNIRLTLTKFNSAKTEVVYNNKSLKDVPELTTKDYVPDAMTPLYDAIGKTINELEKQSHDQEVMVVIMTDGEENYSKEYTRESIFKLIDDKKRKGWLFTFLGANQDAWAAGMQLGINQANAINFTATSSSTKQAFRVMASTANNYSMNASDVRFSGAFNAKTVEDYEDEN